MHTQLWSHGSNCVKVCAQHTGLKFLLKESSCFLNLCYQDSRDILTRIEKAYRKVASRSTCYYSGNQVFRGATNCDMSLNETCFYS